jgi:CRP/FNR family transcriptional regulator, cyclic AMP receptor protein
MTSAIRNAGLFKNVNDEDLKKISSISAVRKYAKGDVLFSQNTRGAELFVVVNGCVAINKNVAGGRKRNLDNLRSGEVFGEISLFDEEPRSADAEVIEDAEVMIIPNTQFLSLLYANPALSNTILKNVVAILCRRLRKTDDMLNEGVMWGFRMES